MNTRRTKARLHSSKTRRLPALETEQEHSEPGQPRLASVPPTEEAIELPREREPVAPLFQKVMRSAPLRLGVDSFSAA